MQDYRMRVLHDTQAAIPEWMLERVEAVAERLHDCWSSKRFSEGWRYGPIPDQEQMFKPCLVPYKDLPEEEKQQCRFRAFDALFSVINSYEVSDVSHGSVTLRLPE